MRKSTCVHKQERTNALAQAMVTQTHLLKQWLHKRTNALAQAMVTQTHLLKQWLHKHQRKYALNQWLPTPGQLPEIRALMLERLRRHREALVLYVHILHSLGAAEAYCDRCSATHTHTHAYTHTHTHTHTQMYEWAPRRKHSYDLDWPHSYVHIVRACQKYDLEHCISMALVILIYDLCA
jgi:hypothetical protein